MVVFWIAHVYALVMSRSAVESGPIRLGDVNHLAARGWPMVQAAVPAVVALVLAAAGVWSRETGITVALILGVADLVGGASRSAGGGARVLDVHADPDHHRAVFTLAGEPGAPAAPAETTDDAPATTPHAGEEGHARREGHVTERASGAQRLTLPPRSSR